MNKIINYGLSGVGNRVEFGKGGCEIVSNAEGLSIMRGETPADLQVKALTLTPSVATDTPETGELHFTNNGYVSVYNGTSWNDLQYDTSSGVPFVELTADNNGETLSVGNRYLVTSGHTNSTLPASDIGKSFTLINNGPMSTGYRLNITGGQTIFFFASTGRVAITDNVIFDANGVSMAILNCTASNEWTMSLQ